MPYTEVLREIFIPLAGTSLGAACVYFMKGGLKPWMQRLLTGFAAGVMVAAAVWGLLIPAMEQSAHMGTLSFIPAVVGAWLGFLFLLLLDRIVPHLHTDCNECEGLPCQLQRSTMMMLAVALHNLPEGMAVGVVLSGAMAGEAGISVAGALALSIGIAVQNFPEGAIISIPLRSAGMSKNKAFLMGVLSGVVEPLGAIATMLAAPLFIPVLPYLLGFAAGAMLYVVVEELIPESAAGGHSNLGTIAFAFGFTIMLTLDVVLG